MRYTNPSIFLLFVILSFNSANKLNAFEPELKPFDSYVPTIYNNSNGLFGGIANDIEQTQEGTLWIGTYNGLYRYSGSSFQSLNQFSNIKNVNCLYTDESDRLWIGTNDSGITISIDDTVSNVLTSEQGLPSDSIRCITQDSNGLFYVGTAVLGAEAEVHLPVGGEGHAAVPDRPVVGVAPGVVAGIVKAAAGGGGGGPVEGIGGVIPADLGQQDLVEMDVVVADMLGVLSARIEDHVLHLVVAAEDGQGGMVVQAGQVVDGLALELPLHILREPDVGAGHHEVLPDPSAK